VRAHLALLVSLFVVAAGCGETFISISSDGRIEVAVSTDGGGTGGLTITVDGGAAQAVPAGGTVVLSGLAEGRHSVLLGGLAEGCTVDGGNPRVVDVDRGGTASVSFAVRCEPRPRSRLDR